MEEKISIGKQDFSKIREEKVFYIDKTTFIQEWWEKGDEVTLLTRPRRFGKTLTMSMTEQFFSIEYAGRGDLFEGLEIWKDEKYRSLQGTYPVISLSFAKVKETDFSSARAAICVILKDIYKKFRFLKEDSRFSDVDREDFDRISKDMDNVDAANSLSQLSEYLHRYYGKKTIILLDEYDTPMQEAYVNGYWNEMTAFIRSLFNATFKSNPYLERGIMTGITRVSKESIFSDLNNLNVVTTTSEEYATAFGFTEEEVFASLEQFGLGDQKQEVKRWYDGFTFGTVTDIYNPWSIINFLSKKNYRTYWANTSSNSLVGTLLREGDEEIKSDFERLLRGESIVHGIDEQIVYQQLDESTEAIWSLLLASGYLKVLSTDDEDLMVNAGELQYELALTNYEVHLMFNGMIRGWFSGAKKKVYNEFLRALLDGNLKKMNRFMNQVALEMFSYFDTGKRPSTKEPERFYHGFVLGLVVDLADTYQVLSNRESGYGRYDVLLKPKQEELDAIIMEFKVHDPDEETTLEETVQAALRQIEEKKYETELLAEGFPKERIRKYGFAFEGQTVQIGEGEKKETER